MIATRKLQAKRASVVEIGTQDALTKLLSAQVLVEREQPTAKPERSVLKFAHHVLFDYAVSRLMLNEETIFSFVSNDPSTTILFRPSLAYFFQRLWFADRQQFWRLAFAFFGSADVPERARVLPAITVYEAAGTMQDLAPLLETSDDMAATGIAGMLRAVQALSGLNSDRRQLWLGVLSRLADALKLEFVNEYVALINIANDTSLAAEEPLIGRASRILLRWMWALTPEIGVNQAISLANIGASRVFPVVAKLYATDPAASKGIVLDVLGRFGSPVSGSKEAFWLAHEIRHIVANDPAVAIEVYRRIFAHLEKSEEETTMGGSVVMILKSTRKQDFSSAYYGLELGFQNFLTVAPVEAAIAAVEAVNGEVPPKHPVRRDPEAVQEFTFRYLGQEIKYISDFSEIWDSGHRDYVSLNLLGATLHRVTERLSADANDGIAPKMIRAIASKSGYGVCWKRILEAAAINPVPLFRHVLDLLLVPELLAAPETTVPAGNVLKAAYKEKLVQASEVTVLEEAISQIPQAQLILRYEKPDAIRNRLLQCIPAEDIQSPALKEVASNLTGEHKVRSNEPYHRSSFGAMAFSSEDWLREQGVDTKNDANAQVLKAVKPLQQFETKYLNEVPSIEECTKIVQGILAGNSLPDVLHREAMGALSAASGTVLKNPELPRCGTLLRLCKSVVFKGTTDPFPKFDPEHHLSFDMPGWGGGLPRIEAAQGVCHYLWNYGPDRKAIAGLKLLSRDAVPAVRYQVASGLLGLYKHKAFRQFWALTEEMLRNEKTAGVMGALIHTLGGIAYKEPDKIVTVLSAALDRGLPATERHDLTDALLNLFVGLFVERGHQGADQLLLRFESDPIKFHGELSHEIFVAANHLRQETTKEADKRLRARLLFQRIVTAVYKALNLLAESPRTEEAGKLFGELLRILDSVGFRVYLALDIEPQLRQGGNGLSTAARLELYFELKPIIELLTLRSSIPGDHYLAPTTAHNVMQTLNGVLAFDPGPVITYGAAVCKAASALSYQFDPMAIGEMVTLVEHVLADHKEVLRDKITANALGQMLDIFVKAGWPQAMQLTFKLDDAIR
jgi:hypothetical protein